MFTDGPAITIPSNTSAVPLYVGGNIGYLFGKALQFCLVVAKYLYLDGLGGGHQIAQHIANYLPKINPQGRLRSFYLLYADR
jgi:hypothetical protein